MCMEDVIIGRQKRSAVTYFDNSSGPAPIIPANASRVHITFATSAMVALNVVPTGGVLNDPATFVVNSTLPPLEFDIETHGDVVTKDWSIGPPALGFGIVVIETFLDRIK